MRRAYPTLAALGLLLASVGTQPAIAESELDGLAQPTEQGGPPPRALARLRSDRFVSIQGNALLEVTQSGRTALTLTVYNLEPGSTHVAHIHGGSCTGPILIPLRDVVADHRGIGTSFTQVPAPINTDTWWVNVHGWESLPSPSITCGKVDPAPVRQPRMGHEDHQPGQGGQRGPAPAGPSMGPGGPPGPSPAR